MLAGTEIITGTGIHEITHPPPRPRAILKNHKSYGSCSCSRIRIAAAGKPSAAQPPQPRLDACRRRQTSQLFQLRTVTSNVVDRSPFLAGSGRGVVVVQAVLGKWRQVARYDLRCRPPRSPQKPQQLTTVARIVLHMETRERKSKRRLTCKKRIAGEEQL